MSHSQCLMEEVFFSDSIVRDRAKDGRLWLSKDDRKDLWPEPGATWRLKEILLLAFS